MKISYDFVIGSLFAAASICTAIAISTGDDGWIFAAALLGTFWVITVIENSFL